MGDDIRGYVSNQIIRKDSGSPAVNYVFSDVSHSVMIDNLGSTVVFFAFDGTANPVNSGTGIVPANELRVFDVQAGSVSIQSSGITSSEVQVTRLT